MARHIPSNSRARRLSSMTGLSLLFLFGLLLASGANGKECVQYTSTAAFPGGSPGSMLSTLLVGDDLGPSVGTVEVRSLDLSHERMGALLIALYWLPYSEAPADLALTAHDLGVTSGARAVLKDLQQGVGAETLQGAGFSDAANTSLAAAQLMPPMLNGTYRPSTPLSVFQTANLTSRGRWVLRMADLGENWQDRTIEFKTWSLVLCPPGNITIPALLELDMAQQAARDMRYLRGAASGRASGEVLSALAGGPLSQAVPTLVTVDNTVQYKTYSQLADLAVADVIRGIDNVQKLYQLPRVVTPLINRWLPWVELFIGGSEFVLQNYVWPGKIVNYALSIAVAAENYAKQKAAAGKFSGPVDKQWTVDKKDVKSSTSSTSESGGASDTSVRASSGSSDPCIDNGETDTEMDQLMDTMCLITVPGASWLFNPAADAATSTSASSASSSSSSSDSALGAAILGGARTDAPLRNAGSAAGDFIRSVINGTASSSIGDLIRGSSSSSSSSSSSTPSLDSPTRRLASWFPSASEAGLQPLNFEVPQEGQAAGTLGQQVRQMYRSARASIDSTSTSTTTSSSSSSSGTLPDLSLSDPSLPDLSVMEDSPFLAGVLDQVVQDINITAYGTALADGLQRLVDDASATASTFESLASSPLLRASGGQGAVDTALALQAGAETYATVLRAGQQSMKQMSLSDMARKAQDSTKSHNLTSAEQAFANKFKWNWNYVRLAFRFAATDGPVVTFQQYLYLYADVVQIRSLSKQLAALKPTSTTTSTKFKSSNNSNNNNNNNTATIDGDDGSAPPPPPPTAASPPPPSPSKKHPPPPPPAAAAFTISLRSSSATNTDTNTNTITSDQSDQETPASDASPPSPPPPPSPDDNAGGSSSDDEAASSSDGSAGGSDTAAGATSQQDSGVEFYTVEEGDVRFDTGETAGELFARWVAEAEAQVQTALSRIPIEQASGLNRLFNSG